MKQKRTFEFFAKNGAGDWFRINEDDAQFVHAMQRDFATESSLSEHKFHLAVGAEYCWKSKTERAQEFKVVRIK